MKDLMRIKSSISTEIEALLNQQVKKEAHSSAIYMSMASWCSQNGFDGGSNYFMLQAEEERAHQLKIFKYLMDVGATAISPEVNHIKVDFAGFREVFEEALEQEISVTQSIKNIVAKCNKENDFITIEFLNWFLMEQREEEAKSRKALSLFDIIGDDGIGKWQIDQELNKMSTAITPKV